MAPTQRKGQKKSEKLQEGKQSRMIVILRSDSGKIYDGRPLAGA